MSVRVGIKKHGQAAMKSLFEELKQLHDKDVFEVMDQDKLTEEQIKSILRTLIFMKEKRDGRLKSRLCVDGSRQDPFDSTVDPSSPTVLVESIFLSLIIDATEERVVKTADIEGAYLIADMPEDVLVMFDEMLAAAMMQVAPEYANFEKLGKLVFKLKKALYGCIQSARLFYEHLRKTLIGLGFEPNPYDPCVFNMMIDGQQCTVLIYVDDLKISCKICRGVDWVLDELKKVYKKLSVKEGKELGYLGMSVDFREKGLVKISMIDLIDEVLEDCPVDKSANSPAAGHLFEINPECPKLSDREREFFHSLVAKLLYIAKRGRPDILLAVIFLTTRVKQPDLDDQKKLQRVISYLKQSRDLVLTLGADDIQQIKIFIDASHAVHDDAKSHTGVVITLGKGSIFAKSSKQKLVSKSSTAAELIALSDGIDYAVWAQEFMRSQGYEMKPLIVYQDNKSTIVLAEKGKSTNQRTRHINIRYYAIKDLIDRGEALVVYKPTEEMVADYLTKPLQGRQFNSARNFIMCMSQVEAATLVPSQGCVE
jgi:N-acetylmuramoyl-L-alanine amidase